MDLGYYLWESAYLVKKQQIYKEKMTPNISEICHQIDGVQIQSIVFKREVPEHIPIWSRPLPSHRSGGADESLTLLLLKDLM
jgi:hypothetical protein